MAWLVPLFVIILALILWWSSFRTDDAIAAWLRFVLAVFLLGVAATVSIGIALG